MVWIRFFPSESSSALGWRECTITLRALQCSMNAHLPFQLTQKRYSAMSFHDEKFDSSANFNCWILATRTHPSISLHFCVYDWHDFKVLYAEAAKQGITTITISQRNTLPEFHTQHLSLGENAPSGWSLNEVHPIAFFTVSPTHQALTPIARML